MTRRRARGFTLIEVLVVLLITAMVSTLLLQGFRQVLDLRVRYLTLSREQSTEFLKQHWFLSLCKGIVPDFSNGDYMFEGDREEFSGLTLSPLGSYVGRAVPFSLRLERDDEELVLYYEEGEEQSGGSEQEEPLALARFRERSVQFAYVSEDLRTHRYWPPMGRASNSVPQNILLLFKDKDVDTFWAARVDSRKENWDERLPQHLGIGF